MGDRPWFLDLDVMAATIILLTQMNVHTRKAGLGRAFLRHIERCRIIIHVVNGASPDPIGDFRAINQVRGYVGGWSLFVLCCVYLGLDECGHPSTTHTHARNTGAGALQPGARQQAAGALILAFTMTDHTWSSSNHSST